MNKKIKSILIAAITFLAFNSVAQTVMIGTASAGGGASMGSIFYIPTGSSSTTQLTAVPGGSSGANPYGSITKANNGKFYGMAYDGGANGYGGIFEFGYTGPYAIKFSFAGASNGTYPNGALCMANDGKMYGLARQGGANGYGVLFSYVPGTGSITVVKNFSSPDGIYPMASVIQSVNNKIYGLTSSGGAYGYGTLFSYDIGTTAYTVLHDFNSSVDGGAPKGSLIEASNGRLYGMTSTGGSGSYGTIFEYNIGSTVYTVLRNFNSGADGGAPEGDLVEGGTALHFWGLTKTGGTYGYGTIFEYTLGGSFTNQFNFQNGTVDGGAPSGSLTRSTFNGNYYGVTNTGGLNNVGTFFEFTPGLSFSKKFDFTSAIQGANPLYVKLYEYMPLSGSAIPTNVSCNGLCNGSATVTPTGGTAPYTYNWSPIGGTSATASGLCAGSYTCTITEAGGFQYPVTVIINQPPVLNLTNFSQTNVSCNGGADGTVTDNGATGGTPGYTYNWTPGNPTGDGTTAVTGLTPGTWTCTVTDAASCTTSQAYTITQPPTITSSIGTQTNVSCFGGGNGFVSVNAGGGTGGFTYSWSPSGGTTSTLSPASAGNYTLNITDVNGCIHAQPVVVTEPAALGSTISNISNVLCNGGNSGSADVNVSGGTAPYFYSWSPLGGNTMTGTFLYAGTYTCNITDVNGCTRSETGINITEPPILTMGASPSNVTCFGANDGSISDGAFGGTPPYSYLWSPGGATTPAITNLAPGNYTLTATDANGCVANDPSTITQPAVLSASASQSATGCQGLNAGEAYIFVTGGSGPYFYLWNSGGTNDVEPGLAPGTYTCNVTDNHGCTTSDNIAITENASTDVTGMVLAPTLSITSGYVYAFLSQASINGIDTVAITPILPGAPNYYSFASLQAGSYLIKVVPDDGTYPTSVPTYYGDEFQWDSAIVVTHGCSVNDQADVNVIELNGGSGTGFISGFLIEGNGFGNLRIANHGHNPNIPFTPGGPLKGVDIKLGKNPGGGIQARTVSDASGYYDFKDIPTGNYTVYVDIPNLPMDSTRNVVLSSGADTSVQNNYYADSLMIFIDTVQSIGIYSSEKIYENKFSIYPNPSKGALNVSFTTEKENSLITIEITNSLGQVINTVKQKQYAKGDHTLSFDVQQMNMKAGVYFMSIISDNKKHTQRLVVVE